MSSILKALKKLEVEKRAMVTGADRVSRDDEGLIAGGRRPQKNLWLLGVGILVGLAAAGGWIYWAGDSPAGAPPADKSARADLQPEGVSAGGSTGEGEPARNAVMVVERENLAPVSGSPRPKSEMGKQIESAPEADPGNQIATIAKKEQGATPAAVAEERIPSAEPVSPGTPDGAAATDDKATAAVTRARSDSQPDPVGIAPASPPAPAAVSASTRNPEIHGSAAPAPYQVMEIFYQAGEGSMAVVDDLPVMEGTVINGARVEKILPDRVRFIIEGQPVEVFADKPQS